MNKENYVFIFVHFMQILWMLFLKSLNPLWTVTHDFFHFRKMAIWDFESFLRRTDRKFNGFNGNRNFFSGKSRLKLSLLIHFFSQKIFRPFFIVNCKRASIKDQGKNWGIEKMQLWEKTPSKTLRKMQGKNSPPG